ncbi:MAG: hypothetical protein J6Z30_04300, partial [Pyramidobacter sp.]|nr:hypothetical protein [Pyramidobacter sp.]
GSSASDGTHSSAAQERTKRVRNHFFIIERPPYKVRAINIIELLLFSHYKIVFFPRQSRFSTILVISPFFLSRSFVYNQSGYTDKTDKFGRRLSS